jgi:hypothetical protein
MLQWTALGLSPTVGFDDSSLWDITQKNVEMYLSRMAWVHIVLTVSCGDSGTTAITFKHTLPQMVTLQALAAEHKLQ